MYFIDSQKTSAEEIVQNLPKVWKVLMELLSHQNTNETNTNEKITTCYKTVETASGSVLVPSVSQTYLRLKVSNQVFNCDLNVFIIYIYNVCESLLKIAI